MLIGKTSRFRNLSEISLTLLKIATKDYKRYSNILHNMSKIVDEGKIDTE